MGLRLSVVDAFTERPFSGNPAAVAVVAAFPASGEMLAIAQEMNHSETAFVVPRPDGDHDLRWFTPSVEVDLCGHATLAAAHVLGGTARFHTRSGLLACWRGAEGRIEMDFPADPPVAVDPTSIDGVAGARYVGRGRVDLLIELDDAATVRDLSPEAMRRDGSAARCVIVTAAGDRPGIDCVSRVFASSVGIPEDPVTGSAHCTLAVYWGDRLSTSLLIGEQASPRGGIVQMRRQDDRVILGGQAVTVAEVRLVV